MTLSLRTWPATFTACVLTSNRPKETEVTTETKVEAVAWLRDIDGTGSLHPCAKGDPGAIEFRPASAITALEGEVAMLRDALHIETHKVITCGVAASHPDASLSRRMEYSGKWDSPQAQQVRALRDKADAAERRVADLEAALSACNDLSTQRLIALNREMRRAQED
jgi:hypothetical protein